MQFMLIFTEPPDEFAKRNDPDQAPAYWGAWQTYIGAMNQAGIVVNGDGLLGPHTATTVRVREGKTMTTDGPFAETREQLGGYYLIEATDLDDAIAIAAKIPGANHGSIEIRPVQVYS